MAINSVQKSQNMKNLYLPILLLGITLFPLCVTAQTAVSPNTPQKSIPVGTVIFHHQTGQPPVDNSPAVEAAKARLFDYEQKHGVKVISQGDYDYILEKKGQAWIDARPVPYKIVAKTDDCFTQTPKK